MRYITCNASLVLSVLLAGAPTMAQDTADEAPDTVVNTATDAATDPAVLADTVDQNPIVDPAAYEVVLAAERAAAEAEALAALEAAKPCELHVWPTENYLGVKMGLLSGFGIVGAVLDAEGNEDEVKTVKDLMRDYLGPDIQLAELRNLDFMDKLKLDPADYRIIIHEPTPWNEDVKEDEELKAEIKALNKKIKKGERITDSTNDCYAELITTHIFYHKAMMYGSNLFTGWVFHQFDGDKVVIKGKGQVKNPLEEFPPKEAEMVEAAKLELRDAYAKDFVEWSEKKVKR